MNKIIYIIIYVASSLLLLEYIPLLIDKFNINIYLLHRGLIPFSVEYMFHLLSAVILGILLCKIIIEFNVSCFGKIDVILILGLTFFAFGVIFQIILIDTDFQMFTPIIMLHKFLYSIFMLLASLILVSLKHINHLSNREEKIIWRKL